jgi:hypothetical protein
MGQLMHVPDCDWDRSVERWARGISEIAALIQIGSRVQRGATSDQWSDFDYQLITGSPQRFINGAFAQMIGPCWMISRQSAFGNVTKVTAIFENGVEADFVILNKWEVLTALSALRFPWMEFLWPKVLQRGIRDLRHVAGRGWKMIKGGPAWSKRYARITEFSPQLSEVEFRDLVAGYWTQLVWAVKKIERGECLAAQRAIHLRLRETLFHLLEAEANSMGAVARPEARLAERWLRRERLDVCQGATSPEPGALLESLSELTSLLKDVSRCVAAKNRWDSPPSNAGLETWLANHQIAIRSTR